MEFAIWTGGPTPDRIIRGRQSYTSPNGVQHPANIWDVWSTAELAAIDAYPFVRAVPMRGERITARAFALVSGQVVESIVTSRAKNLDRTRAELTTLRLDEITDLAEEKQRATLAHRGKQFQVDARSQSRIVAEALHAKLALDDAVTFPWDAGYTWLAADNTTLAMTVDQMLAFAAAVRTHIRQIIFNSRAHKDAIRALITVKSIHEYDITTGWP